MPPPESPEGHRSSISYSPTQPVAEDEFQFLHCQHCQKEAKCPKLLPCLHTLCSACLEEQSAQCSICRLPGQSGAETQALDNIFFESLQRRLSIYRQIVGEEAFCTRCKEPADFWCFECEQLLCAKCFDAHQWYLKHEIRPLAELRSQSVHEFLDGLRKTNNIFCSSTSHRTPTLTRSKDEILHREENSTWGLLLPGYCKMIPSQDLSLFVEHGISSSLSIYCRGCSKPLCCSCALLDEGHSRLKCDISMEIQLRQAELDTMTQALQEQDAAFGAVQAKMTFAVSQLDQMRWATRDLIRSSVRQVITHVRAQECELLKAADECYQSNYEQMAGQLHHLDAVLQRIHTGSVLVQKMKSYASDQEVLDMHGFLREALTSLRREEPQDLQAAVHTDGFEEVKVRLQNLVSRVTQETDAALQQQTSPKTAGVADVPEEEQRIQVQPPELAESQSVAVVQSVPGAHPVPIYAYSIKDPSSVEEVSTPQKRKYCQTECPSKVIKMESEEERESRLAQRSPEQPRPSTSRAISPPHLEGPPEPNSPVVENEALLPNSNHVSSKAGETEERIVVISSSEDSEAENSPSQELNDSSSESSDLQLEGPSSLRALDESLADPQAEDRPLVFFDLKIDNETQKISQLAAVNRESKFRVLIQSEAFSVYSKAVSLEVGLQHFLSFLGSMRRPILACYKLWGPGLPNFFRALEDMNRLWEFQEAISGFLAALPLIRERVPGASSFKLKYLARTYLARNMSERSALAAVLTMRDLCRLLEVSPGPQLAQHVYSFSNLQCFASLQPLVREGILSCAEARLLALHNVSFLELLTAHRRDPQGGLKKYSRYLGLQVASMSPTRSALNLRALSIYFEGLLEEPASVQAGGISGPATGHSLTERAPQQN
ncbi:Protein PML [Galemys pyrenaicus]|uniref:Protein PML n=1 Tax=Galemys pyrenaicus TaxID=202257 RepID=A0A8J6A3K9_GALPY|nr:Protein PML [Galemys pyrenaicus]